MYDAALFANINDPILDGSLFFYQFMRSTPFWGRAVYDFLLQCDPDDMLTLYSYMLWDYSTFCISVAIIYYILRPLILTNPYVSALFERLDNDETGFNVQYADSISEIEFEEEDLGCYEWGIILELEDSEDVLDDVDMYGFLTDQDVLFFEWGMRASNSLVDRLPVDEDGVVIVPPELSPEELRAIPEELRGLTLPMDEFLYWGQNDEDPRSTLLETAVYCQI